jgi:hypothetical protein
MVQSEVLLIPQIVVRAMWKGPAEVGEMSVAAQYQDVKLGHHRLTRCHLPRKPHIFSHLLSSSK